MVEDIAGGHEAPRELAAAGAGTCVRAQPVAAHGIAEDDEAVRGRLMNLEVRIQRVHLDESIVLAGHANRVDPDKWRPLIMSFQHFYGLGPRVHDSALATVPEALYRSPDVDRARATGAALAAG